MIVRFVWEFGHGEGHSPSLREIAEGVGLAASTVSYHMPVLEHGTLFMLKVKDAR